MRRALFDCHFARRARSEGLLREGTEPQCVPQQVRLGGYILNVTYERPASALPAREGKYVNGQWQPGRWLNGDQTHQGRHIRLPSGRFDIQRVKLYRYR